MKMKKAFGYFILIDFIVLGVVLANGSFKEKHGHSMFTPLAQFWTDINTPTLKVKEKLEAENSKKAIEEVPPIVLASPVQIVTGIKAPMEPIVIAQHEASTEKKAPAICVNYGPLNIEQKASMDVLLMQGAVGASLFTFTQEPLYEVFWNVGADKVQAVELFEAQKNDGPLQDEKFKLKQNIDGNWIVPVSVVAGKSDVAKKMTNELQASAGSIGGKWEFKEKSQGYFYQFNDLHVVPAQTLNLINQTIDVLKTPC